MDQSQLRDSKQKEPVIRGLSNTILIASEPNKKTIFLPAYLRVAFKKITGLDIANNSGEMSATVILTIYTKGLSFETRQLIKQHLGIGVNSETVYNLDPNPNKHRNIEEGNLNFTEDEKSGEYTVQWRNKFPLEMKCDVFFTPFEVIDLSINFAIRTISWNQGETQIFVKMNFMDSPNSDLVSKFSLQQNQDFGEYGLAESSVEAEYLTSMKGHQEDKSKKKPEQDSKKILETEVGLNQQSVMKLSPEKEPQKKGKKNESDQQKEKKSIKNWQYAQFRLSVYRYPFTTLVTIYLPVLLLAIISLAVFFQDFSLSGRISSIATLMVAYTAFLPTVRESIPPSPNVTMVDIILYSLISTCLMCLVRSWIDREKPAQQPYEWDSDPLFIISLIVICLSAFTVLLALLLHKFKWEKDYNKGEGKFKHSKRGKFDSSKWGCKEADDYFGALRGKGYDIMQLPQGVVVDFTTPTHKEIIRRVVSTEMKYLDERRSSRVQVETPLKEFPEVSQIKMYESTAHLQEQ